MKIYSNKAQNFISDIQSPSVLVYGNDYGEVKDIEQKIVKSVLPSGDEMAIVEITMDQIKEDEAVLLDELSSMSFFADQKLIKVTNATDVLAKVIENALPELTMDNFLLISAGELTKASKLRKLYEESKDLMAVLCYKGDEISLKMHLNQKFREAKINADPDAIEFLAANLGEDKLITNNEIEKIITYMGDERNLSYEDAVKSLADNSDITMVDLAFSVSGKNAEKLEKNLMRIFNQHITAVAALRMVLWHFQRMLAVRNMMMAGKQIDLAMRSLKPQVFFRQVPQFKTDIAKWDATRLAKALDIITKAELDSKIGLVDAEIICRSALIKLCRI